MTTRTALSRRSFLTGCAAAGSALVVAAAFAGECASAEEETSPISGIQYGFLADMRKCIGCKNCVRACREANQLSDSTPDRRHVETFVNSKEEKVYVSASCMHCDEPNCMRVCPAGAISKGEAGIVHVDKDKCIGCKYCYQACPYGVPNYNSEAMDKCDCCLGAGIAPGETPYCAQACIFGALKYGPIDELVTESEKRGLSPVPIGEPCGPNCYLIGEVS